MSKLAHRHALFATTGLETGVLSPALLDGGFVPPAGPRTTADNWTATRSGTWATAANWSAGVPNGSNDATIATAGTYTVSIAAAATAASLTINDANATVADNAGLSLSGSLTITAGKFVLSSNLSSGTVNTGASGKFVVSGGTLSGVSYQGTLDLSAASTVLSLSGANSFSGTGGTGAATINVTGNDSQLYTYGTETLDNATLSLGNSTNNALLYEYAFSNAATLTFGSHLNLVQAGKYATIYIDQQNTGNTLINTGTITASAAGGTLAIRGPYAGDIFTNTGSIVIGANDTVLLNTNVTTSGLGQFTTTSGGVLQIGGGYVLSNAGATLALGSAAVLGLAGTITGGAITDSGGGLLAVGGTLSGVTYQGTLAIAANASLSVNGGLNVSNGGSASVINDNTSDSTLYFYDSQTIDNTTLNLGFNNANSFIYEYSSTGAAATLTLGSHFNLAQAGKDARLTIDNQNTGNTLINAGTITAATAGGDLFIYGPYTGDVFTNTGTIAVSNNDQVDLQVNVTTGGLGHFSTATGGVLQLDSGYTLSNAGTTLALGNTDVLSLAGTITGGTIIDSGSGLQAAGGTLSGVSYQGGTISIGTNSLSFANGFTTSAGATATTINDTGAGGSLYLDDTQTVDNATLNLGNNSNISYLYEYATSGVATLTLGSHLNLVQSGKNARFYIDPQNTGNTLINAGTITAATAGGDLVIYGPYAGDVFTNTGTIAVSNNDTVDLQVNVTTGGLGRFSTAAGGVLQLDSGYTLSNTGATLALGSATQLTLAGVIAGGTIADSGNGLVAAGGALSGVSYLGGTITIGTSSLSLANGFTTSSGATAAMINDTGAGGSLYLDDTQTVDNATINLGNNSTYSYLYEYSNGGSATLTLGTHLNLVQSGKDVRLYIDEQNIGGNTLINAGTITAATAGGDFYIYGTYAGDVLTNTGTIAVSNNDQIDLQTNVTTGGLGHFSTATGGVLQLDSGYTLSNAGATLALGSASQLTLAGVVAGGTIADSGNGLVAAGGALSGVSYLGGTITIGTSSLSLANGFTTSSGATATTINDTGAGGSLYLDDTQTVDNATIDLGNNSNYSYLDEYSNGGAATLTLGTNLNIVQSGKDVRLYIDEQSIGGNSLINAGTITAATAGGDFYIYGTYAGDVLTNTGTIAVSNNDQIDLLTNITTGGLGHFSTATGGVLQLDSGYTLSNTGATLSLGSGNQLTLEGVIAGGTVADSGNGLQAAGGTLSGVSYQGTLNLGVNGLYIANGLNTVAGTAPVIINDNVAGGYLYLSDKQILDNATVNLGNNSSYSTFYEYSNGGAATLTLGSHFNLVQSGKLARIYVDQQNAGNKLINGGTITANNAGGSLAISSPYAADKFTNTGSLLATSGGTLDLSTAALTNLAGSTLTAGSYEADAGSVIELVNNATVVTDSATIILSGAGSAIQAVNSTSGKQVSLDNKLTTISSTGSLALLAGRNFTASAAFTNSGSLQLGGGTFTDTSGLTIGTGARLSGFGTVASAIVNSGTIEASVGNLVVSGSVTGTGVLQIDGGNALELQNAASSTETVVFATTGALRLDNAAGFAGAIAGFGPGDTISIGTLAATSATFSGTSLAITLTGGTVLNETLTTAASNEHIGISADGHTLTAYRFAAAGAHVPEPVAFGSHHVGDLVSQTVTLTNTAAADGFSEKLDASVGATTGSATDSGSFSGLAAGQSSALLSVGLSTATAGALSGTAILNLSTDGAGVDGAAPTAIGTQTVNVTGSVYNYAVASLANGGTVALGNTHVGTALNGFASLTNGAAAGAYSEGLDAAFAGSGTGVTVSGSIVNLAAGGTSSSALGVGLAAATAGALSGTATLSLASDGATTSGLGTTALAGQTVTVTGTAYNYAAATPANGGTVALGNVHVGGSASGFLTLTNSAAANLYSEGLDASLAGASAGFSASGSLGLLAAGASNSTSLAVGLTAAAAGALSGTATLTLASDGTGTSNLGTTALAAQTVTITGAAYNYAAASVAGTLNVGIVHVGGPGLAALTLGNSAAAGLYSEGLDAGFVGATGAATDSGTLSLLAAGSTDSTHLLAGINTSAAGTQTGTVLLGLVSDGAGTSGLGTTALGTDTITVVGVVDNYAVAAFADAGGPAISGSGTAYSVNLGSVQQGGTLSLSLGALNAATGTADLLGGTLSTAGGAGFTNTGFGTFSGLSAGQSETAQSVSLSSGNTGVFTETVVLTSAGSNASGYSGALAAETLTITGTVFASTGSTTYVLSAGRNVISGANGGDVFQASALALNSHDQLTGGVGSNVLQLIGSGVFDIGAPSVFANIPSVTAMEGQAASKTAPDTRQTIFMRDGVAETLTVLAGTAASGNTNAEAITIYAGTGADAFVLAAGQDSLLLDAGTNTVTLGGAANSITAGSGTATISGAITAAGAAIAGNSHASTTLNITSAGTATLNAADTYLTVNLAGSSKLSLGSMGFITVNGGAGSDTITAGGANQTLIGGTKDVLTGAVAGTDSFRGASTALNGDTIGNWTTGDVIDITDMNSSTLHTLTFAGGKLGVTDGTHTDSLTVKPVSGGTLSLGNFSVIGSDGHGGTLIGFHS